MTPITIPFEPIDSPAQIVVENRGCKIVLHESHLEYILDFTCDQPKNYDDPLLGYEQLVFDECTFARKSAISRIDFAYTTSKTWLVGVVVQGGDADIKIFFKSKERQRAHDIAQKLKQWAFDHTPALTKEESYQRFKEAILNGEVIDWGVIIGEPPSFTFLPFP